VKLIETWYKAGHINADNFAQNTGGPVENGLCQRGSARPDPVPSVVASGRRALPQRLLAWDEKRVALAIAPRGLI
jgi:hypothetical protein